MDGGRTGSGNGVVVKKNKGRGRPRKYGPLPAPSIASPNPSTPTPQQKRGSLVGSGSMQRVLDVDDKGKQDMNNYCDNLENGITHLEDVLHMAKIRKDIRYKIGQKVIESLEDDAEVWCNMGNNFNDELLDQMKARYGPYKTITEGNLDEFLDELFMRTKIEMIDDKGKAKVTAELLDELFISRKKETLKVINPNGKSIEVINISDDDTLYVSSDGDIVSFGNFSNDLEDTPSVSSDDGTSNHRKGMPAEGTIKQRKEVDDKQMKAKPYEGTSE